MQTIMDPKSNLTDVSFDQIARRLLKERLPLTTLELFAELTENGKDLPYILKDYINSFNDCNVDYNLLERSNSLQTFDSLDLTRSSDDGQKTWEQIAVLEFELRKAKETINNLRETLTYNLINSSDFKNNIKEKSDFKLDSFGSTQVIKPQEKRAINYLINDYLLKQNYKLTSITFSEENENQDFDDWLDVGLNITKPPDLLHFYRFYWFHSDQFQNKSNEVQSKNFTLSGDFFQNFPSSQKEPIQYKSFHSDLTLDQQDKFVQEKNIKDNFENDFEQEKKIINKEQIEPYFCENNQASKGEKSIQTEIEMFDDLNFYKSKLSSNKSHANDFNKNINLDELNMPKIEINLHNLEKSFSSFNYLKNLIISGKKTHNDDKKIIISMLTQELPQLISNLPNPKKCESFPLLIVTILFNQNKSDQNKLLKLLYTTIKKPNEDQRKLILSGLICLANCLNCDNILSELLSNFLEDVESKTLERRLLITECISCLAPFASSQLKSSLLSLLQPLVQDRESQVQKLSYNSLSTLTSLFFEEGQFEKMSEIMVIFLNAVETTSNQDQEETSTDLFETLFNTLLLPIAFWSFKSNNFEDIFLAQLISKLMDYFENETKQTTFFQLLTCFNMILPFVFAFVIKDAPIVSTTESIFCQDFQTFKSFLNQFFDLKDLTNDEQIKSYLFHINKEWFKTWTKLNWIVDYICETFLFKIITKLKFDLNIIICMTDIFKKISQFLGVNLTRIKLKNLFLRHLKIYEADDDIIDSFTNSVLPIYFNAIFLSHSIIFQDVEEIREMTKCLQIGLMNVSLFNYSLISFEATIAIIAKTKSIQGTNFFIFFLRESSTNSNSVIKKNVANIYKILIDSLSTKNLISDDNLINSILPSLSTLSADVDLQVRASAISAYGSFLSLIRYRISHEPYFKSEFIQKVQAQLQTYFNDPINRDQHLIQLELIKMITKVTSFINNSQNDFDLFFIRFVIPVLSAFAAQAAQINLNQKSKKQDILLALLETYGSISKISNQILIDQSIEEAILPALRCIKDQVIQVAPDYKEASVLLINEFERRASPDHLNFSAASNFKSSHSNLASSFSLPLLISSQPLNSSIDSSIIHNQVVDNVKTKVKGILNRSTSISNAAKAKIANIFKR